MEQYIGFAILLFLLSMICERLADFLKHFIGEENGWQSTALKWVFKIGDTTDKGLPNSKKEDRRYYRILKINIVCGFITAFILHADFFSIIKNLENPEKALSWVGFDWEDVLKEDWTDNVLAASIYLVGCLFTGLFISFGSKFWHDLLDLLLEVKNIKRKIADKRTYEVDDINQFDEFIRTPESKLALLADERFHDEIEKIPGVISVGPGYVEDRTGKIGCLEVHIVNEQARRLLKTSYKIELSSGMIVDIPVNIVVTGEAQIHGSIVGAGMLISNETQVNGRGSIGCVVRKKADASSMFFLSCFHVLSGNQDLSIPSDNTNIVSKLNGVEVKIGKLIKGERTSKMDAAIALITNSNFEFSNGIILNPKGSRVVTSLDARRETVVRIFGGKSGLERKGVVHNDTWKEPINYDDEPRFLLEDLIVLTRRVGQSYNSLSEKGDSGSLVIDDKLNQALGIVVGGDEAFTYAIKMTSIEKYLETELI